MIAAISSLRGVEVVFQRGHAITGDEFIIFLRLIKRKAGLRPVKLFLDNLGVHHRLDVRAEMTRLEITPIWNAIYSPRWNPIEMCFAKVKRLYKQEKLRRLVRDIPLDMHEMIIHSFGGLTADNCRNYIRHCWEDMETFVR